MRWRPLRVSSLLAAAGAAGAAPARGPSSSFSRRARPVLPSAGPRPSAPAPRPPVSPVPSAPPLCLPWLCVWSSSSNVSDCPGRGGRAGGRAGPCMAPWRGCRALPAAAAACRARRPAGIAGGASASHARLTLRGGAAWGGLLLPPRSSRAGGLPHPATHAAFAAWGSAAAALGRAEGAVPGAAGPAAAPGLPAGGAGSAGPRWPRPSGVKRGRGGSGWVPRPVLKAFNESLCAGANELVPH